jgi:TRAP-type C4-dicarboxylate transport system permease small subunit
LTARSTTANSSARSDFRGLPRSLTGLAIPVFLVWHVLAAVRTLSGDYTYPLVGDAARSAVYDGM